MNTNPARYSIDRVGDAEWAIFDSEKRGDPTVYALFVTPVVGLFNYQVILTAYDAIKSAEVLIPIFDVEIYSMFFYSIPEGVETMIHNVFLVLLETDIENPVELAYTFGGTVRSESVRQVKNRLSH